MPRKCKAFSDGYNKAFPKAMREIMRLQGKTQQDVANYLGKSRQAIACYCDGSSSPDWETIVKLADYFEVSTDYLLGLTLDPSRSKTAVDELGLTPEAIEMLLECKKKYRFKHLSDVISSIQFFALLANIDSLEKLVCRTKEAHAKGYSATQNDALLIKKAEDELSQKLGYEVSFLHPRIGCLYLLQHISALAEDLAKTCSGFKDLTDAERYDDALDADIDEVKDYWKNREV